MIWTSEQEDYLRANYEHHSFAEMAASKMIDKTRSAVASRCRRLGLNGKLHGSRPRKFRQPSKTVVLVETKLDESKAVRQVILPQKKHTPKTKFTFNTRSGGNKRIPIGDGFRLKLGTQFLHLSGVKLTKKEAFSCRLRGRQIEPMMALAQANGIEGLRIIGEVQA